MRQFNVQMILKSPICFSNRLGDTVVVLIHPVEIVRLLIRFSWILKKRETAKISKISGLTKVTGDFNGNVLIKVSKKGYIFEHFGAYNRFHKTRYGHNKGYVLSLEVK
ncbi:hypothetical protein T458_07770 [Brevibacillus panacihumi W25]|uniref:Uncharacterized protein n=1 Tax=Brevibacillus panacihumi W25 TaxID=1408254 RepID=V6MAY6_9BACL|nr:hypothetical protein T458_07770 [Brevibacillus panacihumi W25]